MTSAGPTETASGHPHPRERNGALDGLRGVAVLLVVASHVDSSRFTYAGAVGVTVFFVLSGFLITRILEREWQIAGRVDLRAFFARRALRLYPAFVLVLLLTPLLLWITGTPGLRAYPRNAVIAGLYLSDFVQATGFDWDRFGILSHTWSLAVEEQFYLIWPAILISLLCLGRRAGRSRVVAGILTLTVAALTWRVIANELFEPLRAYCGPDTNAFALLLGCSLALVGIPRQLRAIWPLALFGIGFLSVMPFGEGLPYELDMHNWVVVLAGLFAVPVVSRAAVGTAVLDRAPLRVCGLISYGLYLWHYVALGLDLGPLTHTLPVKLAVALSSFGVAWLSYRLVETPALRLKRRFERTNSITQPALNQDRSTDDRLR